MMSALTDVRVMLGAMSSCSLFVPFAILAGTVISVGLIYRESLCTAYRVVKRDFQLMARATRMNRTMKQVAKNDETVVTLFQKCVHKNWNKTMFVTPERSWTYGEAEEYTNQVANYFAGLGFQQGDAISLVMENRPEYIFLWLGLSKIGAVTALINTNLKQKPLAHTIQISASKAVIFSPGTAENFASSIDELRQVRGNDLVFYCFGECALASELSAVSIDSRIASSSKQPTGYRGKLNDNLIYIYTSGTTGLPKAAVIKNRRYIQLATAVTHVIPVNENDIMYHYLPLYHLAAGVLGVSQTIIRGCTGVVAPKFSATKFWIDCKRFDVTICQYIGEIARYLLMQPVRPEETQHKLRVMFGNGLRSEIWTQFQTRFKIPRISEVYGSTEGIANMVNIDNRVGAIGSFPITLGVFGIRLPVTIIKVDPISGVPLRNSAGRCVECAPGEIGEIVATIRDNLALKFDGYVESQATSKKIYRDCFKVGDRVFSSGDLAYRDALGYVYFKDRTGDTYKWKGENVSTTEVESVLNSVINNPAIGCSVFGVEVPQTEGKAGMAVLIDAQNELSIETLAQDLALSLPSYAMPIFIRVAKGDDTTGTYKMSKTNYKRDAFDIEKCRPDPVFFLDLKQKRYVPLEPELFKEVTDGSIRL